MKGLRQILQDLSIEALREWAGTTIFNRGRKYLGRVSNLSHTEDSTLVARVSGTQRYVTSVRLEGGGEFEYLCSCPFEGWRPCKHVVAVLLAALEMIDKGEEIPLLDSEDDLYLDLLKENESLEDMDESEEMLSGSTDEARRQRFFALLADRSREELQEMLVDVALLYPDVARDIEESTKLEQGEIEALTRALRKEIHRLTDEEVWYEPWKDQGSLPDYSHVEQQLRNLLDAGYADAVRELGEELWERGNEQVAQAYDEGETAAALTACMEIVLEALPRTFFNPAEQLLWYIDRELEDEYGLLGRDDAFLQNSAYAESDWLTVAENLEQRLRKMPKPRSSSFPDIYPRNRIMNRLCDAYRRSSEATKIIPLLEKEARYCQCYDALVDALLEKSEREKARQWCIKGFDHLRKQEPGLAHNLQKRLRRMAEEDGRLELAAAYRAQDFFNAPSLITYQKLGEAAGKINLWPEVRQAALAYLQSGFRPESGRHDGGSSWPLPEPEVKEVRSRSGHGSKKAHLLILIEIAIAENRTDDAVELFRELRKAGRNWSEQIDKQLAEAVRDSHPEVALQIWHDNAMHLIGQVKTNLYPEAAGYLRRMQKVFEAIGQLDRWTTLLAEVRREHRAKRRLMEVLDDLVKHPGRYD